MAEIRPQDKRGKYSDLAAPSLTEAKERQIPASTYPRYIDAEFEAGPKGDAKAPKRIFKIRIKFTSIQDLEECAKRAVVIACGTKARDGKFPIQSQPVEVDAKGNFKESAEYRVQQIKSMAPEDQESAIRELEATLRALKGQME